MNRPQRIITIAAITAIGWTLIGRTLYTLRRLLFRLSALRILSISDTDITIAPTIQIKNPTPYPITLRRLTLHIYIDTTHVATIDQYHTAIIAPRTVTPIAPTVNIRYTPAWQSIINSLQAPNPIISSLITIRGKAAVDSLSTPLNISIPAADIIYQS